MQRQSLDNRFWFLSRHRRLTMMFLISNFGCTFFSRQDSPTSVQLVRLFWQLHEPLTVHSPPCGCNQYAAELILNVNLADNQFHLTVAAESGTTIKMWLIIMLPAFILKGWPLIGCVRQSLHCGIHLYVLYWLHSFGHMRAFT